ERAAHRLHDIPFYLVLAAVGIDHLPAILHDGEVLGFDDPGGAPDLYRGHHTNIGTVDFILDKSHSPPRHRVATGWFAGGLLTPVRKLRETFQNFHSAFVVRHIPQAKLKRIRPGCNSDLVEKCFAGEGTLHAARRTDPGWPQRGGGKPTCDRLHGWK